MNINPSEYKPEIVGNKKRRWFRFLRAEASGRLLERPNVPPLWQPHKLYQPQMPDRLQSGYADVEHELVVMTQYAREHGACVLFVVYLSPVTVWRSCASTIC